MIGNHLKPVISNEFRYEKNSEHIYTLLKEYGSLGNAIRNAKRLAEWLTGKQNYANHNPCTMVFMLIEELLKLN